MTGHNGYRDLEIWRKARELATEIYRLTSTFPAEERYGLTSQIRRAAVSVAANIAEGWGRDSEAAFTNFLRIARGSLAELQTLLVIASDLELIDASTADVLEQRCHQLGGMIFRFAKTMGAKVVREELVPYDV